MFLTLLGHDLPSTLVHIDSTDIKLPLCQEPSNQEPQSHKKEVDGLICFWAAEGYAFNYRVWAAGAVPQTAVTNLHKKEGVLAVVKKASREQFEVHKNQPDPFFSDS